MNKQKTKKTKQESLTSKVNKLVFVEKKSINETAKILNISKKRVYGFVWDINHRNSPRKTAIVQRQVQTQKAKSEYVVPENMKQYIPNTDGYIARKFGRFTDVEILERSYNNGKFVLLEGETGTGKTHLVRHFAFEKKLPYARINLNGGTTADELLGRWVPNLQGGFRWQDGLLTIFVRNGGIIALDEVNACPAEILFALHSLTDDERTLKINDEVIHAHEHFFLVGTMNPNEYEGTKPLNWAFASRFKIKLYFDYDAKIEKKLIEDEKILEIAEKLRLMHKKGEISTPISTRELIAFDENRKVFDENLAYDLFLNNFEKIEQKAIQNVIELLKNPKKEKAKEEEKQN